MLIGTGNIQEVASALGPILRARVGAGAGGRELAASEGLELPEAGRMAQMAVGAELVQRPLRDAIEWIRRVVRAEYLRGGWEGRLVALRGAVGGEDAIAGGWTAGGRPLQVVVTMERIHVVSKLPREVALSDEQGAAREGLENAVEMLAVDELAGLNEWKLRPVAGMLMGNQEVTLPREWHETLFFVTDGKGVKYTAMKYKDRDRPERERANAQPPPWFESMRAIAGGGGGDDSPPPKNVVESD